MLLRPFFSRKRKAMPAEAVPLIVRQGTLLLHVKWKGYENPEDETMEPEENLLYVAHLTTTNTHLLLTAVMQRRRKGSPR